MTQTSYEVALPNADVPGDMLMAFHTLMTALGLELGARYDAHCRETIGADWMSALQKVRKAEHFGPQHLYDPSFVIGEPLHNPNSPTRACLPKSGAFYNQMDKVRQVRNDWNHYMVEQSLDNLDVAVTAVHKLATMAEMTLGAAASTMRKRIKAIRNGTHQAYELATNPTLETPSVPEYVVDTLNKETQSKVSRDLESGEASPHHPTIGAPWELPLPPRRIRLTKLRDIVDADSGESLRSVLGERADAAISGWLALRPMGDLFADPADGALVGFIAGTPRLIGYLGSEPKSDPSAIRGFAIPHHYRVSDEQIVDVDSNASLQHVAVADTSVILRTISDAISSGGSIRVTTYGDVVLIDDDGKKKIAHVTPDEWFPGQLFSSGQIRDA